MSDPANPKISVTDRQITKAIHDAFVSGAEWRERAIKDDRIHTDRMGTTLAAREAADRAMNRLYAEIYHARMSEAEAAE